MTSDVSAMILTGGASSRFGSDKSQVILGSRSLIENLLTGLPPEIEIVIVGPKIQDTSRSVQYAREDPPGGGPVAAIHAGLDLINSEFVAIIATDMPFAHQIWEVLISNLPRSEDATIPLDSEGVRQTLCALYRADSLRRAFAEIGEVHGQSMRNVTRLLSVKELQVEPALQRTLHDIDTPADLEQAITLSMDESEGVHIMDKWIKAMQKELAIDVEVDQELILNLARDVAHTIERKAAPISTFLLGIAIAGGADPKEAAKRIELLAANWPVDPPV
jgi:molybdopterin-guanine dinucleotide biosynthesis protein A